VFFFKIVFFAVNIKINQLLLEIYNEVSKLKCPKCGEISTSYFEYILWD
jgi:NMD protein affecting ribosome stability and mRNA decay